MINAEILNWTTSQLLVLLIIMIRTGPLIFLMPVMGSNSVPSQVKILATVITALALTGAVKVDPDLMPESTAGFVFFVLHEICLAFILALFSRFIFAATQMAGQMVGIQMGMGMAGVMDPQYGIQVPIVGQLWNLIAILFFLSVNGHHIFFYTLAESFQWVTPGTISLSGSLFEGIIRGAGHMFVLSVKIMAPASAAVFFSHVAMGIIAKTVPQVPILIVGMPINIAVGFIFIGLSLIYFMPLMINQFAMLDRLLPELAMILGG